MADNHYVFGNVCSPIEALLIILGMVVSLRLLRFNDFVLFGLGVFFAGTTAYYHYPPITRMELMVIPWVLFAATGWLIFDAIIKTKALKALLLACIVFMQGYHTWMTWDGEYLRFLNPHQYFVRVARAHPHNRYIIIAPYYWDISVSQVVLKYQKINVSILSECDPVQLLLNEINPRDGVLPTLFLDRDTILPPEIANVIVAQRNPVIMSVQGFQDQLPLVGVPLTEKGVSAYLGVSRCPLK